MLVNEKLDMSRHCVLTTWAAKKEECPVSRGRCPLLCSIETPDGVLHPHSESSAKQRHEGVGAVPKEGYKNGDSPYPLLHSFKTPSGVLCSCLGFPEQERHGLAGAGPEEGHKNASGTGTPLL